VALSVGTGALLIYKARQIKNAQEGRGASGASKRPSGPGDVERGPRMTNSGGGAAGGYGGLGGSSRGTGLPVV
jgi:hypothetical protein